MKRLAQAAVVVFAPGVFLGCEGPEVTTYIRRPPMVFQIDEALSPPEPTGTGDADYVVHWTEPYGAPIAELRVTPDVVIDGGRTVFLEIVGTPRGDLPVARRYLGADDFEQWSVAARVDGQDYRGSAAAEALHMDVETGVIYVTFDVAFAPVDGDGAHYTGRLVGEGVVDPGVACVPPAAPRGVSDAEMDAAHCAPIREAIGAVPDDPDAPPPPWDPAGEVDGCGEVPCGGVETAPLPD